ncbi:hypothetical protein SteCoe_11018 [Stentor coeruleus]|uniref:Uncharacterized protein n=1 Tax=Stentor coeruleus TaxID=5963 RepID=A0A1R2CE86_9CILI|nr:hypothetical protein SteCoe_11018 [Stentor coeruleus]
MFLKHAGYEEFPTRKDLMSMNTIENPQVAQKNLDKTDYRSLKTDDIIGAKPKGLNNASSFSPSPGQKSLGYIKNAANFFGTTPPVGAFRKSSDNQIADIPNKALAGFFGATPPPSRPIDKAPKPLSYNPFNSGNPYEKSSNQLPDKAVANFYGVTPPQSRSMPMNRSNGVGNNNSSQGLSPEAAAKFFGVTPVQSSNNPYTLVKKQPDSIGLPPDVAAKFYGVTPNQSRSQSFNLSNAEKNTLPPDVAAKFYGVTPPQSRSQNPFANNKNSGLPADVTAKFYGVTPPQSRNAGNNSGNLPPDVMAKFYGVTPPQSRAQDPFVPNNNSKIKDRNFDESFGVPSKVTGKVPDAVAAKFYGVTPPQSRLGGNAGYKDFKPQNNTGNRVFGTDASKFFGDESTPEQAQKLNGVGNKDYQANEAKFFGVTPPLSRSNNISDPNIFSSKALRLFT